MSIFKRSATVEELNQLSKNTLSDYLGIRFTEVGADYLKAEMPVNSKTHQPFGLLHGGASVAMAETMGSVAAMCCVDVTKQYCVGLDINANHIRGVRTGTVTGITKPLHVGKKTHVWEIRITNEEGELVCISRLTMAVLDKT